MNSRENKGRRVKGVDTGAAAAGHYTIPIFLHSLMLPGEVLDVRADRHRLRSRTRVNCSPSPSAALFRWAGSQSTLTKLTDQTVSRVHCQIENDGKRAVLVNVSSILAPWSNGKPVSQHELKKHGDFGPYRQRHRILLPGCGRRGSLHRSCNCQAASARRSAGKTVRPAPASVLSHHSIESVIAKGQSGVVFKAHRQHATATVLPSRCSSRSSRQR